MPVTCAVYRCPTRSGRDNIKFFRIPAINNRNTMLYTLSKNRQNLWMKEINRTTLNIASSRVCSRHFVSGRSAKLQDVNNIDWVPTLKMGYGNESADEIEAIVNTSSNTNQIINDENIKYFTDSETDTPSNNENCIQVIEEDPLANVDDILTKNGITSEIDVTCRTCSTLNRNAERMNRIFNYDYESSPVNLVGKLILNRFNICEDDDLPQQICNDCYNNLKRHNEFWNKCILSQTILKNKFSTNSNSISKSKSEILTVSNDNNNNNDESNNSLSKDVNNDDMFNDNDGDYVYDDDNVDVDDGEEYNYDNLDDFDVDLNECNGIENNKSCVNNNYNDIVANNDDEKNVNEIQISKFVCKACNQYFKTEKLLIQHIFMVHNIDDKNSKKLKLIKPKTKSSLPPPPLPQPNLHRCDICDMICKDLDDVRHHKRIHYGGKYKCDECGKFFAANSDLNKHINNIHKVDQIVCFLCGLVFTSNSKYDYHKRLMHDVTKQKKCRYCDKVLFSTSKRKIHERIHTGERPNLCTFCGKGYRTTGLLKLHMRTHTNKYPNTCEICNNHYSTKPLLRKHLELHHSKITEYICKFCKKIYLNKHDLEQHYIKIHMVTEPKSIVPSSSVPEKLEASSTSPQNVRKKEHKCRLCGVEFLRNDNLVDHMDTVHVGAKPFACAECNKQFKNASSLEQHKRFHTGETPFKCKKCDKSFMYYINLASHMLVHNGRDNPFKCQYCNKTYFLEHNLKVHLLKHTGEQNEQADNAADCDMLDTEITTSILEIENIESYI